MMMSSTMRLQGELRSLVTGVRGLVIATSEVPKKPNTPWLNYYTSNLPTYQKSFPELKIGQIMKKVAADWKMVPEEQKMSMKEAYEAEKVKWHKQMEAVPEEVKEAAANARRSKKAITDTKSAASELKVNAVNAEFPSNPPLPPPPGHAREAGQAEEGDE
jgi:hypothetical protein